MRYYWKVWLLENGSKSIEYTDYMVAPFFYEGCLNKTINTGELILDTMPISTKKAFPPKTRFLIERYVNKNFSDEPKVFDVIVDTDRVEEYVNCPEICCHRIDLISPSALAQSMHVDNISLTYELQDATLNYKTTVNDSSNVSVSVVDGGYSQNLRQTDAFNWVLTGDDVLNPGTGFF